MKTRPDYAEKVSASLDMPDSLAPFATHLMHGVDELGSYRRQAIALCRKSGFGRGMTVMDMACGIGLVAIQIAATFDCLVTGIDICPNFIVLAQSFSSHMTKSVRFRRGDIQKLKPARSFDAVVMLNLLPIDEAAEFCRQFGKPGAILILDDATLAPGKRDRRWSTVAEVCERLEGRGLSVIAHQQVPVITVSKQCKKIEKRVAANGRFLLGKHPEIARPLATYLKRLKSSRLLLTSKLRPTLFAVKIPLK